jgi:hypothetical protein
MELVKEAVDHPFYGHCTLLNQLILTALGEKIECITLVSVDKSKTSTIPGDLFVDDTAMGVASDDTNREPTPIEEK